MSPIAAALAALALAPLPPLAPRHARFLEEEVHFLVSSAERARFHELTSDEERDRFVELFWRARDPTPGTEANEAKQAHERRLARADRLFPEGSLRGRFTERGRILTLLGAPAFRESFTHAGGRLVPAELWHYTGVPHAFLPDSFHLIFFRPLGEARFRLFRPPGDGPSALLSDPEPGRFLLGEGLDEIRSADPELAGAVARLATGPESANAGLLASLDGFPDLASAPAGRETVRATTTFDRMEAHLVAAVVPDDAGVLEVHYAFELASLEERFWEGASDVHRAAFHLVGRLEGLEGEIDRWEDRVTVELRGTDVARPVSFQGRRLLPPGASRLVLSLVHERGGIAERSARLARLVLVRPVREEPSLPHGLPFRAAGEALSPVPGPRVTHGVLAALFLGPEERGDVVFEIWKESRRVLVERDASATPFAVRPLPLQVLEPGSYRLRAVHAGGAEEWSFEWRPDTRAPLPRTLVRESLPDEAARYREQRAASFLRRGERGRAVEELELAVAAVPGSVRLHLELASIRYAAGRHEDVVAQLESARSLFPDEPDLYVLLAASSEALGDVARAVELYERASELSPQNGDIRAALARARARRDR